MRRYRSRAVPLRNQGNGHRGDKSPDYAARIQYQLGSKLTGPHFANVARTDPCKKASFGSVKGEATNSGEHGTNELKLPVRRTS